MAITYTWKVTGVKTKTEGPYQQAVVQTYWTKTGTDENGNTGTFTGATPFTTANLQEVVPENLPEGTTANLQEPKQFIPFAELTEEIVLGWIQEVVVGGYEEHVNGVIERQINEKINPVVEAKLPWAPEPTPEPQPGVIAENISSNPGFVDEGNTTVTPEVTPSE